MSLSIASWSSGTDEQIVAMIEAASDGTIDLQEDGGWAVGDVRTITVGAFTSGDGTSHAEQSIDIVITSFDDYMNCGCVMQFDFKDTLATSVRMNAVNQSGGWGQSEMKTVTLPALVSALPSWLRGLLLEFSVLASDGGYPATIETVTGNRLALRSEVEVFGTATYSTEGEGSQINYYATSANRIKKRGHSGYDSAWWERSFTVGTSSRFCICDDGGDSDYYSDWFALGVAPFGCLGVAKYEVKSTELTSVANAIREKGGTSALLEFPDGFVDAVDDISGISPADEGKVVSEGQLVAQTSKNIGSNGTHDTTLNNQVVVNVTPNLQQKTALQNGTITPDSGYDGLSQVVVNVPGGGQQPIASWDFTSGSLIDSISGLQATINSGVSQSSAGLTITALTGAVSIPNKVKGNRRIYEVDFGSMEFDTGSTVHHRLFMPAYNKGVIYRSTGYWSFYNGSWATDSTLTDYDFFANSTMKITVDLDGNWKVYKDGVLVYEPSRAYDFKGESGALMIGSTDGQSCVGVTVEAIRIYQ